jgi:hypothetical protein
MRLLLTATTSSCRFKRRNVIIRLEQHLNTEDLMDDVEFAIADAGNTIKDLITKLQSEVSNVVDRDPQLAGELSDEIEALSQSGDRLLSIAGNWHGVAG